MVQQIHGFLKPLCGKLSRTTIPLFGGNGGKEKYSTWNIKKTLKSQPRNLIVATPARLCDFVRMGTIPLSLVTICVVDEVDRMCGSQFLPILDSILSSLNPLAVRGFYSATFSTRARRICEGWCGGVKGTGYVDIKVGGNESAGSVEQHVVVLGDRGDKVRWLRRNLGSLMGGGRVMVFVGRRKEAEEVGGVVKEVVSGGEGGVIHGDVRQR